jgi:integrase
MTRLSETSWVGLALPDRGGYPSYAVARHCASEGVLALLRRPWRYHARTALHRHATDLSCRVAPRALDWELVPKQVNSVGRHGSTGWPDQAVLHLTACYGLRESEVVALTLSSINRESRAIPQAWLNDRCRKTERVAYENQD